MGPQPAEAVLMFPAEEPPTVPRRTSTGHRINSRVVRAMSEQYESVQRALLALDRLLEIVTRPDLPASDSLKAVVRRSLRPPPAAAIAEQRAHVSGRYHMQSAPDGVLYEVERKPR